MLKLIRPSARERCWSEGFLSRVALRALVGMAALGAGVVAMQAQTSSARMSPTEAAVQAASAQAVPVLNLQVPAKDQLFSSSADEETASVVTPAVPNFGRMMMGAGGGHGQAYEKPRYRSAFTNPDGSLRYTAYIGGGSAVPVANASNYLTPNFDVQGGVGPRFSKHFELPVEFEWAEFGFTGNALDNQIDIYDSLFGNGSVNYLLDGNSHIWSFSLQPTFTFYSRGPWGAYAKAGVGFYHKVANFTLPSAQYECYYFCGIYEANYNLDHYTSNAPGYDAGFGLTYQLSPDSHARLYMEGRYVYIDNQQRSGIINTYPSVSSVTDSTTNFYPANSNRTEYIPVTVGIRF